MSSTTYTTNTSSAGRVPRSIDVVPCARCQPHRRTVEGLYQHYVASSNHPFFCRMRGCESHFASYRDMRKHTHAEHHWCEDCDLFFGSAKGLYEHHRQASAHQDANVPWAWACEGYYDCTARFEARAGLRMHRRAVHQAREVKCPLKQWTGCERVFVEEYDAVKHIEGRGCLKGLDDDDTSVLTLYVATRAAALVMRGIPSTPGESSSFKSPLHAEPIPGAAREGHTFRCPGPAHAPCGKVCRTRSGFLEHAFSAHSASEGRVVGRARRVPVFVLG